MNTTSTIADLIGASLIELRKRLPDTILMDAIAALSADRPATLARHRELEPYLARPFLSLFISSRLSDASVQVECGEKDAETYELLVHSAIRWWLARDVLWPHADTVGVLSRVEGDDDPHGLFLLKWMCQCGAGVLDSNYLQFPRKPAPLKDRGNQ